MSKLSSELRLTVTCHICVVNSEFAVARRDMIRYEPLMLFFDRYHFRETRFFRDRSSIRKAGVIE